MASIRNIILIISATFLFNTNVLAINGSAIGEGKEVLKIEECGKDINYTIYDIQLKPDEKWRMESPSGSYSGKYEVVIPGEKLSLSLSKNSKSRLYEYIGQAGKSLCDVKKKVLSRKIKKFIVKLDNENDALKTVLIVKYKATDGTTRKKGEYKVIVNAAYTSGDTSSNPIRNFDSQQLEIEALGFDIVSDEVWDETAVRKVMHTFAFGGQATDQQITQWSDMPPVAAIIEMLTFDEHNNRLSPLANGNIDRLDIRDGTLRGLSNFWSSDHPYNGIPHEEKERYNYDAHVPVNLLWERAAISRGLNPFRQKIGLWETNYHLAINIDQDRLTPHQTLRYYDDILNNLADGKPYQSVITTAASSAAVAVQYGHNNNLYIDDNCRCNEDFAREYYQLFFGILGDYDPILHENETIKNTAAALTDMQVPFDEKLSSLSDEVTFGTEQHFPYSLTMLQTPISGQTALERLELLSDIAINHPESQDNLPVMIISGLADDNLNETKIAALRSAWRSMQDKRLLPFLRGYAISTLFHSENRVKFYSSIDRNALITNKVLLSNKETYSHKYAINKHAREDVHVFRPIHNVFGNQTGVEAARSAEVFRKNYNNVSRDNYIFMDTRWTINGLDYEKDWSSVIPKNENNLFILKDVAEWLWQHFMADGLKNFGILERAHVYSLLATIKGLTYLVNPDDQERVISSQDLENDPDLIDLIIELERLELALDSADTLQRKRANSKIGLAIDFIVGTPYIFAQEGR